jgi:predicted acetyltransferase
MSGSYEVRPVTEEEWPGFVRTDNAAFGEVPTEENLDPARRGFELDRSVSAIEAGVPIGAAASYPFEMALPGGDSVPTAGVTWVGVRPTHRRRGVLTAMMRHQLEDVHRRGEPVAILLASESIIYQRFGYGLATFQPSLELDRHRTALLPHVGEPGGRLRLVEEDEARKLLPEIHERCWRQRAGDVRRTEKMWESWFRRGWPQDGKPGFDVIHEGDDGRADGYAVYRVKREKDRSVVHVYSMYAENDGAYLALWRYVTDIDLTSATFVPNRPQDEAFRYMLADPRRLEQKGGGDFLWARLVDVPAALAARRYSIEGRLVLEVRDAFCPWNEGRYVLEGGPDGATCERTSSDTADLTLTSNELGAAYLGGTGLGALARAGRIDEHSDGAVRRAHAMFLHDPAPWCGTYF